MDGEMVLGRFVKVSKTRGIDIDIEKASKVKKIFALYASGNYNLRELAEWYKRVSLKSNLDKFVSISQVPKILQNVFYLELMKYKDEIYEGTHEPIISKKLFDKVQEVSLKLWAREFPHKFHLCIS